MDYSYRFASSTVPPSPSPRVEDQDSTNYIYPSRSNIVIEGYRRSQSTVTIRGPESSILLGLGTGAHTLSRTFSDRLRFQPEILIRDDGGNIEFQNLHQVSTVENTVEPADVGVNGEGIAPGAATGGAKPALGDGASVDGKTQLETHMKTDGDKKESKSQRQIHRLGEEVEQLHIKENQAQQEDEKAKLKLKRISKMIEKKRLEIKEMKTREEKHKGMREVNELNLQQKICEAWISKLDNEKQEGGSKTESKVADMITKPEFKSQISIDKEAKEKEKNTNQEKQKRNMLTSIFHRGGGGKRKEKRERSPSDSCIEWYDCRPILKSLTDTNNSLNKGEQKRVQNFVNDFADRCIQKMVNLLLDKGDEGVSFEEIKSPVEIKLTEQKSDAILKLTNGLIKDVTLLSRKENSEVSSSEGSSLRIAVQLRTGEIEAEADYVLKMENITKKEKGRLAGTVPSCSGSMELKMDRSGSLTIQQFTLETDGPVFFTSDKSVLFNKLTATSKHSLSKKFRTIFRKALSAKFTAAFRDVLSNLNNQLDRH